MKENGSARLNSFYTRASQYNEHSRTKYGKELLSHTTEDLAYVLESANGNTMKVVREFLNCYEVSETCMRVVINHMMGDVTRSKLAADMRDAMRGVVEAKFIEKYVYGGKRKIKEIQLLSNRDEVRKHVIANSKRKKNVQFLCPTDRILNDCAFTFIGLMTHHPYCPVVQEKVKLSRHYAIYIRLKEGVLDWVKENKLKQIETSPWYLPLTSEPKPWTSITDGAYPDALSTIRFLRSRDRNWEVTAPWENFKPAADAASYIATKAHRVDEWTYNLINEMYEKRFNFKGFPMWDDLVKRRYTDKEWEAGGKIESRKIIEANMLHRKKRMTVATSMSCFKNFVGGVAYLPMKADYRGRLYTIPHEVSYQNGDLNRAMLWFDEGESSSDPSTDHWLRRQIANLWGWDKKSINERVKFVDEYKDHIKRWVDNPKETHKEWGDASDPWQFIAACKEWVSHIGSEDHKHTLPIGMDASNNGLQILSILSGDIDGCISTNVLPSDNPQDFYNLVVEKVTKELERSNEKFSNGWLDVGIDRKCVKVPTMTMPYGGTVHSAIDHSYNWYHEKTLEGVEVFSHDEIHKAKGYLGKVIMDCVHGCLPKVKPLMEWFKDVARLCVDQDVVPEWRTPSGFVIRQYNVKQVSKMYRYLGNTSGMMMEDLDVMDKRSMTNSIVPNFVHGIDSAIAHLVIEKVRNHPVAKHAPISTVHDCYNTTAPYAELMCTIIREVFVDVMKRDLIGEFIKDMEDCGVKDIPKPPEVEHIDLNQSKDSLYLFS